MCELRLGVNYFYNDENDGYDELRSQMNNRFNSIVKNGGKIFKTNAEDMWETFISNLPENARQFYNCNACRHFFNRYGGLVTINENGAMSSVLFEVTVDTPKFFLNAVVEMNKEVLSSKVIGVFIPEQETLGYPVTGEHTHFYAKLPKTIVNRSLTHTASQVMAEKREEFKMLVNALNLYSLDTVGNAVYLIQSDTLYRSQRFLSKLEWFKDVMEKKESTSNSRNKRNILWLAIANAPTGHAHIRSGMVGTLLDDIQSGLPVESIVTRFEEKMSEYMRSTATPSEQAIFEAERVVSKLGIENSLGRRYATYEEIPEFIWRNRNKETKGLNTVVRGEKSSGVFGHLAKKPKDSQSPIQAPSTVMTWEKFKRTVLPTADSIEVLVDNANRLMAMITALDETAPNILQWNNPFSWYYHGGVDGEMKRRVEEAGGRYENNEIRVSLMWEGSTDLDLHCITPRREHISYNSKRARCGGYLDLDMNGLDQHSETPVENMRWENNAPEGRYRFYVHNFSERRNGIKGTPFTVELEINGKTYHYVGQPLRHKSEVTVFEFNYIKGQQPQITSESISTSSEWDVEVNQFVKVNGITTSPNLWGANPSPHSGSHIFFLLDGVKDLSEGKGRGFFNEMLQAELRPIRKTLELYTANTPIEDADKATACGLGYSIDNDWNLTVKVKSGGATRLVKIDRWD